MVMVTDLDDNTTDENGSYQFCGLIPGDWLMMQDWIRTHWPNTVMVDEQLHEWQEVDGWVKDSDDEMETTAESE